MTDSREALNPRDIPIIFSRSEIDRFMALVVPEPNSGCWLWLGAINAKGYGRFGRGEMAHRASLRLHGRSVPTGLEVDHKCRVRCCVNPDHLEIVTHRENLLRSTNQIVAQLAKTHCLRGHPLNGDNLALRDGSRRCRACDNDRNMARYQPTSNRRRRKHLTADEVARIRNLIVAGHSHSAIAREMAVSVATVSNVRRGVNNYD